MSLIASVVIPTYRRPDLLKRCLAALALQSMDPSTYEIIVADDGADEETRLVVEHWGETSDLFQWPPVAGGGYSLPVTGDSAELELAQSPLVGLRAFPPVRYLPMARRGGPAAARNAGWRTARGQVIAFTDDDTIPSQDWLQAGVDAILSGYSGVMGRTIVPLPDCPTDYELMTAGLESAEFITANCFYWKPVLREVGGFDERFTTAWREDSDLYFTLIERGFPLARSFNAIVVHPVREARWGISLREQKKSRFNALLYRKHRRLFRQKIQAGPPPLYYEMVLTLLGALAGIALGLLWWVAACLLAWSVMVGIFCERRLRYTSRAPRHVLEMVVTSALIPPISVYWRLAGALRFRVWFF